MKCTLMFYLGAVAFASCGHAQETATSKIVPPARAPADNLPVENLKVAPDAALSRTVTSGSLSADTKKSNGPKRADIVGPFLSPGLDTTAPSPPSPQAVTSITAGSLPTSPASNVILLVPVR